MVDVDDFGGEGGVAGTELDVGRFGQNMGSGENEAVIGDDCAGAIAEEFGRGRGGCGGFRFGRSGFVEFQGGMAIAGVKDDGSVVGLDKASTVKTSNEFGNFAIERSCALASREVEQGGGIGTGVRGSGADVGTGKFDLCLGVAGPGGLDEFVVAGERIPECSLGGRQEAGEKHHQKCCDPAHESIGEAGRECRHLSRK